MNIQNKTVVGGLTEFKDTEVKKRSRFLFFKTTRWETVSTKFLGNDIHIETQNHIRNIYLNGKKINIDNRD